MLTNLLLYLLDLGVVRSKNSNASTKLGPRTTIVALFSAVSRGAVLSEVAEKSLEQKAAK